MSSARRHVWNRTLPTERRLGLFAALCAAVLLLWSFWPVSSRDLVATAPVDGTPDAVEDGFADGPAVAGPEGNGRVAEPSGSQRTRQVERSSTTAGPKNGGPGGGGSGGSSVPGGAGGSIKVAFTIASLEGIDAAGFALGIRQDIPDVIRALVDDLNARGGINGRRVNPVILKVDPINESDQRAKCLQATEHHKVFAVIDVTTMLYVSAKNCITIEHRTVLVTTYAQGADVGAAAYPLHVSPIPNDNRIARQFVARGHGAQFFSPQAGFRKLGVLNDSCQPKVTADLFDALAGIGIERDEVSEFTFTCDYGAAQAQVSQAVLQHKSDEVSHVLAFTSYTVVQTYTRQASAQLFRPKYLASDFDALTNKALTAGFDPDQWDGTRAVTATEYGGVASGAPMTELAQGCNRTLERRGVPVMTDPDGVDVEAAYFCENLRLFELIATKAGPTLTRDTWGSAIPQVGAFRGALVHLALFDRPGKVDGGDALTIIEWRKACRCYVRVAPFSPSPV